MGAFFCACKIITNFLACTNIVAYHCPMNTNNTTMKNSQAFTNIYGETISFTPFFHNACNVWRVSKNVNSELYEVYENKAFNSLDSCQAACTTLFNKQN